MYIQCTIYEHKNFKILNWLDYFARLGKSVHFQKRWYYWTENQMVEYQIVPTRWILDLCWQKLSSIGALCQAGVRDPTFINYKVNLCGWPDIGTITFDYFFSRIYQMVGWLEIGLIYPTWFIFIVFYDFFIIFFSLDILYPTRFHNVQFIFVFNVVIQHNWVFWLRTIPIRTNIYVRIYMLTAYNSR